MGTGFLFSKLEFLPAGQGVPLAIEIQSVIVATGFLLF
jgi:hypothetical protein